MDLTEEQRNCPYCHVVSDRPCYPIFDGYLINDVTGKKTADARNVNGEKKIN